jgi:hypothetical protein
MSVRALVCAALLAATSLRAGTPGTTGESFLQIPIQARPSALSGADTALATGVEGLEYNPASLGDLSTWDLSANHLSYFDGINLDEIAVGVGNGSWGAGFSVLNLATPEVSEIDANGNEIGTFHEDDVAVTLGMGASWRRWSLGILDRGVWMTLAGYTVEGSETDVGLLYHPGGGWRFGSAVQHLGTLGAAVTVADPTPLTFRCGFGWQGNFADTFSAAFDVDGLDSNDYGVGALVGVEVGWSILTVRAGGEWNQEWGGLESTSFGGGIRLGDARLDYAMATNSDLGITQRFGLTWRPGSGKGSSKPAVPQRLAFRRDGEDLQLSWSESRGAVGYRVYMRRSEEDAFEKIGKNPLSSPHARLKKAALENLGVAVAAVDSDGVEGPLSEELRWKADVDPSVLLMAPSNLRLSEENGRRMLVWDGTPGDGKTYQVLVSYQSGSGYSPVGKPLTSSQVFVSEKSIQQPVFVVVHALWNGKTSENSNEIMVLPR